MPETDTSPKPFFPPAAPPPMDAQPGPDSAPIEDRAIDPPPADETDRSDWMFPSLDTEHLRRLRAQLRTNIPGDGTHAAAVSTLLGALVDFELMTRPPLVVTRAQGEPATGMWPHDGHLDEVDRAAV
jgi:hypothetical protein